MRYASDKHKRGAGPTAPPRAGDVHRAVSRPTEYLTLQEAAERYRVSVMTLRRRIRSGALPAVHNGARLIRIPDSALEQVFTPVPNATWWAS